MSWNESREGQAQPWRGLDSAPRRASSRRTRLAPSRSGAICLNISISLNVCGREFPDALDFLSRSLRAGHPLPVSLELLAQDETPPLATEMRKTTEERRLGMPLDKALDNLARRVPLINVRVFVAAVKLQSRTGGR